MAIKNFVASQFANKVLTGKDGLLYAMVGGIPTLLGEVEQFRAQFNVSNTDWQPCGTPLQGAVMTGYSLTLTFTETAIRDDVTLGPIVQAMVRGEVPEFQFMGTIMEKSGIGEVVTFRQCVPDGSVDLMNVQPGDIVKREWSFRCNEIPELISARSTVTALV